jgi:hypothetical protein
MGPGRVRSESSMEFQLLGSCPGRLQRREGASQITPPDPCDTAAAKLAPPLRSRKRRTDPRDRGGATRLLPIRCPTGDLVRQRRSASRTTKAPAGAGAFGSSGGGIRTRDLRVMSPTSYQTAPPRGGRGSIADVKRWRSGCRVGYRWVRRRQVRASQRSGWGVRARGKARSPERAQSGAVWSEMAQAGG